MELAVKSSDTGATIYGDPGDRARLAGLMRALWPLLFGVALSGVAIGLIASQPELAGVVLLVAATVFWYAARSSSVRVRSFFKGARGEERVAAVLARLPAGYTVFHGVDGWPGVRLARGGDIDHVVVGESGIWLIETKCWDGRVTVDENGVVLFEGMVPSRDPLVQARALSQKLADGLEHQTGERLPVTALVCFAGSGFASAFIETSGVLVCGISRLIDVLQSNNSWVSDNGSNSAA